MLLPNDCAMNDEIDVYKEFDSTLDRSALELVPIYALVL